ncbi:N-formylglutamate amidohydrolase [Pseudoroseomonas deserti]|uniref:N-formylglutamate amidohydrolase n=1 Tax=Teichococcus deserti TaxID=1817963 RepID=A0A1V2GU23_9PROT|nr:N-formylglutamate amidohydrolase [Pseudoroseomonas deserti]ONG42356.1 N-formylglutamate amidohydrolase [Pseudoroseomonas deserti]
MPRLLGPGEPPAVTWHNRDGASPCLLLCEHASNRLPKSLGGLGLPPGEIDRHIGWDPGALLLAKALSARLDAMLIASGYSRLVIDCNRPPGTPSSIPARSEDTVIPGNLALRPGDAATRERELFFPFAEAVTAELDARQAAGRPACVVGVHSFTPVYRGVPRIWEAGLLYDRAEGFARPLVEGLRAQGIETGDNQPYQIEIDEDYTVPVHGDARGLPALLIEVRQDLLADAAGIALWADRLAPLLRQAMAAAVPA